MIPAGAELVDIKALLGHESIATTLAYFAQYLAIIGVYVCLTHYVLKWLQTRSNVTRERRRSIPERREPALRHSGGGN